MICTHFVYLANFLFRQHFVCLLAHHNYNVTKGCKWLQVWLPKTKASGECKKCCMPPGAAEMAVKLMASPNEIKHFGNMFALLTRGVGGGRYCGITTFKQGTQLHLNGQPNGKGKYLNSLTKVEVFKFKKNRIIFCKIYINVLKSC